VALRAWRAGIEPGQRDIREILETVARSLAELFRFPVDDLQRPAHRALALSDASGAALLVHAYALTARQFTGHFPSEDELPESIVQLNKIASSKPRTNERF